MTQNTNQHGRAFDWSGKTVADTWNSAYSNGSYDLSVHGPNGFLRGFRGETTGGRPEASARFDAAQGKLVVTLRNTGARSLALEIAPSAYVEAASRQHFSEGSRSPRLCRSTASRAASMIAVKRASDARSSVSARLRSIAIATCVETNCRMSCSRSP